MPARLAFLTLTLSAALAGCSEITPRQTLDRMIEDCMREGRTEDQCQQELGCEPGLSRSECRRTLRRSLDIWVK